VQIAESIYFPLCSLVIYDIFTGKLTVTADVTLLIQHDLFGTGAAKQPPK
jgi:hypothetical protein